ncbi:AAA family ATPase [Roseomonas sp. USHLN139]|uniref:AAA family ATPase n=1 Tax=Roseomonas sp. USHLN139 TaxID=3081298 RepID=UPI003B017675
MAGERGEGSGGEESRARKPLIGFARDAATEAALREGFAEALPGGSDIRRGSLQDAIAAMRQEPTPQLLLVDVSGEAQPLAGLEDLAHVLEPDVRVLVVGEREDMDFYRRLTRGLGVHEYLFKPLVPEIVARLFATALGGLSPLAEGGIRGGRVITVTGARGGSGASTLAVNLAWHLGQLERRHSLLLDTDLHCGAAALLLGGKPGPALREALQNPERLDELYVERAVQPVGPRLGLLAAEEALQQALPAVPGAAARLLALLQRRYNFIVIDLPFRPQPLFGDLFELANQRVIVLDPSLPALRETLRLGAWPASPNQARRPVLVLNKADRPGGLQRAQVEAVLQQAPDVVIPHLPRPLAAAEAEGLPALQRCGPLREAIAELAQETGSVQRLARSRPGWLGWLGRRRGSSLPEAGKAAAPRDAAGGPGATPARARP